MIEAEINGKIKEIENSEDLLTSTVFGLLRYISDDDFLLNLLSYAVTIDGFKFLDTIDVDLKGCKPTIKFWEAIEDYGEPDLIIEFENEKGQKYILCIEVKYYSSKSGEGDDDQLMRYFKGLSAKSYESSQFVGIIYLTKYPSISEMKDSLKEIKKANIDTNFRNKLFQLRWFHITRFIQNYDKNSLSVPEQMILSDLLSYLENKNLVEFTKFSFTTENFIDDKKTYYKYQEKKFEDFSFQANDFNFNCKKTILYGG